MFFARWQKTRLHHKRYVVRESKRLSEKKEEKNGMKQWEAAFLRYLKKWEEF